jgi:hypothetical protein
VRGIARISKTLVLLVLGVATGCLDTHSGRPEREGKKPIVLGAHKIPGVDGPMPDQWVRVFVGDLPRPRLGGYLRSQEVTKDGETHTVHWVYDEDFRLVGSLSDYGITTKFDRFGQSHDLGALKTEFGLLAIYGYDEVAPIRFVAMPSTD